MADSIVNGACPLLFVILLIQRCIFTHGVSGKPSKGMLVADDNLAASMSHDIRHRFEKAERIWLKNYLSLLLFRQKMGHCDTAIHANGAACEHGLLCEHPEKTLDRWILKQRSDRRNKLLCKSKIVRLSSIGVLWDTPSSNVHRLLTSLAETNSHKGQEEIWKQNYHVLLFFRQTHGHCNVVTMGNRCEDKALGRWVRWQRQLHKVGTIRPDRCSLLDAIGFCWQLRSSDLATRGWDAKFADLVRYKARHGDCGVPEHGDHPAERALGRWVTQQRVKQKLGQLGPRRTAELSQLGFIWDAHEADWEGHFRQLMLYRQQHGSSAVYVARAGSSGPRRSFALWVHQQRSLAKDGSMPSRRRARLDSVDFCWDAAEAAWHRQLHQLRLYAAESGHCHPPPDDAKTRYLAQWLRKQHTLRGLRRLPRHHEKLLEEVGVVFVPHGGAAGMRHVTAVEM